MFQITKTFTYIILILFSLNAFAAEVKVTASGKVKYSNEYSEDVKDEAIINAQKAALKKATRKYPKAKLKLIRQMKSEFFGNYDDFVVEAKVQREKHDEKNKVFRVSILAIINQNAIEAWLQDNSQSDSTDDISNFGLVVIVTDQVSSKEFDERRVNIRSNESQRVNEEKGGATSTKAISSSSQKSMSVSESGGSTTKKRDDVAWAYNGPMSEEAFTTFSSELEDLGFEPQEFMELDLSEIEVEDLNDLEPYVTKRGTIPGKVVKVMRNAALDAEWQLFGYGTIQVQLASKAKNSSMYKVPAQVTFKTWLITDEGKFKSVASVKKTVAYGVGSDKESARTEAINAASELAMRTVLSKLQQKGIK
jgi:hypothetical protein